MSTISLYNSVAVGPVLATFMLPVAANVPALGSYGSTLASNPTTLAPPAMSTFPLASKVAVWSYLAADMLPVAVNAPALGSYNSALAIAKGSLGEL